MDASVSLPDPGQFHRGHQNGHAPELVIDPSCLEEQTLILEAEFRAELDRLQVDGSALLPGFEALTYGDLDRARHGQGNQVPRCQTQCPHWCAYADLPEHGDQFDTLPETEVSHRSVQHDIHVLRGGEGIDHAGHTEVSVQLEQDRDQTTGPVITLSVVVQGIEQYAWLTTTEARALHHTLGQLLTDTTGQA